MLLRWQMPLKYKMLMLELIAHALMPLMNTHASVAKARYSMQSCKKQIKHFSENRVDPNQSNSLSENMLIHVPYESISLHTQHWHYFKIIRFLFNYIFFQKIYSDTPSVWIHLKFRILSRLIWVHLFWRNNHQKTHACNKNPLTQPHCMGSSVNLCLMVIHYVCRTFIIYKK